MAKTFRTAGIMSGTSLDGVDVALVDINWPAQGKPKIVSLGHSTTPYTKKLRQEILAVSNTTCHTRQIARLSFQLAELYAEAFLRCCEEHQISAESFELIGSHGQTIYHEGPLCTLQIGEGAVIAERTGVETVSNFRPRDMAAGGHGAPLVPFFDWLMLTHAKKNRVALNLGGIANVHALPAGGRAEDVFAFDTGPANMVLDQLAVIATKGRQSYDKGSRLALRGHLDRALLDELLKDSYFRQAPPKSAGREQYGEAFIARLMATQLPVEDLIATATTFTAATVALGIERFIAPKFAVEECIVAGGGVHNPLLMSQLQGFLPAVRVYSIEELGIPADAKEAIAFALLAVATKLGRPANLPSATGARHPVVLGQINPARYK